MFIVFIETACIFQSIQLVFFRDAVEHVVRAARVFRQPGGHLLLVSVYSTAANKD